MSTSANNIENKAATDPFDRLIFEGGLRIKTVWFDRELDLIVILLNNKKILQQPLSNFKTLEKASLKQLLNFENDGIGIHWPELDEDLSLRGFLKYEILKMDSPLVA